MATSNPTRISTTLTDVIFFFPTHAETVTWRMVRQSDRLTIDRIGSPVLGASLLIAAFRERASASAEKSRCLGLQIQLS